MQPSHSASVIASYRKPVVCHSSAKPCEKLSREEVEQQVAEFLQRGGKITQVPNGVATLSPGAVIVCDATIAVPRPNYKCNTNDDLLSLTEAAKLIKKSRSWLTRRVADGEITPVSHDKKTSTKLVKRCDVLALANKYKDQII